MLLRTSFSSSLIFLFFAAATPVGVPFALGLPAFFPSFFPSAFPSFFPSVFSAFSAFLLVDFSFDPDSVPFPFPALLGTALTGFFIFFAGGVL